MQKKIFLAALFVIILSLIITVFSSSKQKGNPDEEYQEAFYKNYKIFAIDIPADLTFAGEPVPTKKFDTRESLDRELHVNTYWQSQTLLFFKRANRWFPVIEPILSKNGIPQDFKYLALIESGFSNIVSPAGAAGYWQFMKETAKSYKLELNEEVDERYNVEKATEAACKYFKDAYKQYNNWTLVAASYNIGSGALNKQLTEQRAKNYYDLLLTEETARYVFRALAIKILMENPKRYGFFFRKSDLYPPIPVKTITIDSTITNLADFAIKQNINYKILKEMNPWLRKNTLTVSENKKYIIKIPLQQYLCYDELINDANNNYEFKVDTLNTTTIK